jgi:hypothetical protein
MWKKWSVSPIPVAWPALPIYDAIISSTQLIHVELTRIWRWKPRRNIGNMLPVETAFYLLIVIASKSLWTFQNRSPKLSSSAIFQLNALFSCTVYILYSFACICRPYSVLCFLVFFRTNSYSLLPPSYEFAGLTKTLFNLKYTFPVINLPKMYKLSHLHSLLQSNQHSTQRVKFTPEQTANA